MKTRVFTLSLILSASSLFAFTPASAQETYTPPPADESETPDMLERGIESFMGNLLRELGPEMERFGTDMSGAVARLGPVMEDLSVLVDDLRNYQTPERLENGDIIIRRSPDAPPPPPIGENLRDFTTPDPEIPIDPDKPEIEL